MIAGMRAAPSPRMPHHAHDELPTISDADLVTTTGGFMQFIQQAMGMAGQMVNQFGDDKAKQGFAQAQGVMGQAMPMIGNLMSMFGGGGGGG